MILAAFAAVQVFAWLYGDWFGHVDNVIVDRMSAQDARADLGELPIDGQLVFIDANFYYQRSQHASIIASLAESGVSAQLVDFIFQNAIGDIADRPLIEAVASANHIYMGMSFDSLDEPNADEQNLSDDRRRLLFHRTRGGMIPGESTERLYVGNRPQIPFYELASVARGIGFLNLRADPDGVLRRTPLLVSFEQEVYPSISLLAVCHYFGVSAADIVIDPGKNILLKNARIPASGGVRRNIEIPIDGYGNLRIKYTGSWNQIKHFSYRDIDHAVGDAATFSKLKAEMDGKIAILTENVAAEVKVPPVHSDGRLTAGEVHALIIQNILSGQFLREVSDSGMIAIELMLLSAVLLLSLYLSPIGLLCGSLLLTGGYVASGHLLLAQSDVIVPFVRPVSMVATATLLIIFVLAVERAVLFARTVKAKQIAERELEIGRRIQSGFFPPTLPVTEQWEIATHFEAAKHVAGDFYDAFRIGGSRHIGVVIADVCDTGVGAALYMALFRSLIRILSGGTDNHHQPHERPENGAPAEVLLHTVRALNDYISVTHAQEHMFATLFFGILDPQSGRLYYINGGHEPPILIGRHEIKKRLDPTGPAVGAFPYHDFSVGRVTLEPGDILFGYTDGVIDARNPAGEPFSRDRLMEAVLASPLSPRHLIADVKARLERFTQGEEPFDDITLLAIGRQAENRPSS